MELIEEWNNLFKMNKSLYLYGAGSVAKLLVKRAMQDGVADKIKGILVSEKNAFTLDYIGNIPVLDARTIKDKNAVVLVAASRKCSDEIMMRAVELGFSDIRDGFKYVHVYDEVAALDATKEIENLGNDEQNIDVLIEKINVMYGEHQLFDENGRFYQSLPLLDIVGERSSDIRINIYGLEKLLEGKKVIDVGCNTGFLDMTLSTKVKSIYGIEYNQSLVDIANVVISYFHRKELLKNVTVSQADFLKFETTEKYEVVLFFAVHGWLDCSAQQGVEKIIDLLTNSGMVVFESQDLEKGDPLYKSYCYWFERNGMKQIRSGTICDDGKTNREWCVYSY